MMSKVWCGLHQEYTLYFTYYKNVNYCYYYNIIHDYDYDDEMMCCYMLLVLYNVNG